VEGIGFKEEVGSDCNPGCHCNEAGQLNQRVGRALKKQETRRDGEGHSMRRRHRSTERSRFQLSERLNEHTLSRVQREHTNAQIDKQTDRQTDRQPAER